LKADRVVYSEIMIPDNEIPVDPGAAVAKLGAWRAWADAQEDAAFQIEFLAVLVRHKPRALVESRAASVLALHRAGLIAGVAFAGAEEGYPVHPLRHMFAQFHTEGIGIQIHAGEWCGPESVWDALEHGFPQRIGHGVRGFTDPRLVETIQARGIHLEMCPTSNLLTGSIPTLAAHPLRQAVARGMSVSVSTDDPGVFDCTMGSEYALLARELGFGAAEFDHLYRSSLAARFQPDLHIIP
jgi:adenosine deaminase